MRVNPVSLCFSLACLWMLSLAGLLPAQEKEPLANRNRLWKLHVIDNSSRGADGVRLADVNGDGLLDIATGWEQGKQVRVCLNPGPAKAKQPWPSVQVGSVGSPEDAVFVDLDGDGAIDVVSCCEGGVKSVFVHWAPKEKASYLDSAAWKTEAVPALKGAALWMFCLPMQVDGKNGVDLVIGAKGNAELGWLESPTDPRKLTDWKWHPICPVGWVMSLRAADMDGDGDLDVLVSDRKGQNRGCRWLENPGPGEAQARPWKNHLIGGTGDTVMFLDLVDLDRDGQLDVIVPTASRKLLFLRRKASKPPAWEKITFTFPERMGGGKGVRVGDIDLDGKLDIVLSGECGPGEPGLVWLSQTRGVKDPHWNVHELSGPGPKGFKADRIELLDLDGDGDLDVITTEERSGLGVIWYENPTR